MQAKYSEGEIDVLCTKSSFKLIETGVFAIKLVDTRKVLLSQEIQNTGEIVNYVLTRIVKTNTQL